MKYIRPFILAIAFLSAMPSITHAQGAGMVWDILNQEVVELYQAGEYDRAVVVSLKALEVAKQNVGPNHPDVATSLENLAVLYRATNRDK